MQQAMPSLEVHPEVGIRVPAMRSIVNRQVSAAPRARNTVRSLVKRNRSVPRKAKRARVSSDVKGNLNQTQHEFKARNLFPLAFFQKRNHLGVFT